MRKVDSRFTMTLAMLATVTVTGVAQAGFKCEYPMPQIAPTNAGCTAFRPDASCIISGRTTLASDTAIPPPGSTMGNWVWRRIECAASGGAGARGSQDTTVFSALHLSNTNNDYVLGTMAHFNRGNAGAPRDTFMCYVYNRNGWGGDESGENTIASLPDSLSSSVGLYPAGGGFPNIMTSPNPLAIEVTRSITDSSVTIRVPQGGLETSAVTSRQQAFAAVTIIVYPTSAAAIADPENTGSGSSFIARVSLIGSKGSLVTSGGTTNSDWNLVNNAGKWTATPDPGLTLNGGAPVPVPSPANAVVRVVADARSLNVTPGQSPLILVLMTLALLGSGAWVIRSRRASLAA